MLASRSTPSSSSAERNRCSTSSGAIPTASRFPTTDWLFAGCGAINGEPVVEGKTAAPVLCTLPAHVECHVDQIVDTDGDHAMVILRAVEADSCEEVRPLTIAETPWEYGG